MEASVRPAQHRAMRAFIFLALVVDFSLSQTAPTVVGAIVDSNHFGSSKGLAVDGNYAYAAGSNQDKINVVDISTPASPSRIASTPADSTNMNYPAAISVPVGGSHAIVVSEISMTLSVVDISTPGSPSVLGHVAGTAIQANSGNELMKGAWGVHAVGTYAYVASYQGNSLTIVDFSTPTSPTIVGSISDGYVREDEARTVRTLEL